MSQTLLIEWIIRDGERAWWIIAYTALGRLEFSSQHPPQMAHNYLLTCDSSSRVLNVSSGPQRHLHSCACTWHTVTHIKNNRSSATTWIKSSYHKQMWKNCLLLPSDFNVIYSQAKGSSTLLSEEAAHINIYFIYGVFKAFYLGWGCSSVQNQTSGHKHCVRIF